MQRARVSSNGWAGKGVYTPCTPPSGGFRYRRCAQNPRGREFARGASPAPRPSPLGPPTSPHPTTSLRATLPPQPPFSPSPPAPHPPPPPMVSTTRFCGNPSGTFSYRCPATCRIRRFPNERPIEITRPVVFGLRAYRMVQHPPESPRGTFLNTAREHCCISQSKANSSSPKYFRRFDTSSAPSFAANKIPNIVFTKISFSRYLLFYLKLRTLEKSKE